MTPEQQLLLMALAIGVIWAIVRAFDDDDLSPA